MGAFPVRGRPGLSGWKSPSSPPGIGLRQNAADEVGIAQPLCRLGHVASYLAAPAPVSPFPAPVLRIPATWASVWSSSQCTLSTPTTTPTISKPRYAALLGSLKPPPSLLPPCPPYPPPPICHIASLGDDSFRWQGPLRVGTVYVRGRVPPSEWRKGWHLRAAGAGRKPPTQLLSGTADGFNQKIKMDLAY